MGRAVFVDLLRTACFVDALSSSVPFAAREVALLWHRPPIVPQ